MAKVTIWIRKEDEEKWNAIENKPAWLHEQINHSRLGIPAINGIPLNTSAGRKEESKLFCKHGADPKLCKYAQPGKPCK